MNKLIESAAKAAGGKAALARAINVSPGLIWQWIKGERPVPAKRCADIERASAGQVRCEDIRPDKTWHRDANGAVTGYTTPVATPNQRAA